MSPEEQVVRRSKTVGGVRNTFWCIHDKFLGYWRGTDGLCGYEAWTRDLGLRRQYDTRVEAERAMERMQAEREQRKELDPNKPPA